MKERQALSASEMLDGRGRPAADVDYETCPLSQLRFKISRLRQSALKVKNPVLLKKHLIERGQLEELLARRVTKEGKAKRTLNKKVLAAAAIARAARTAQKKLDRAAKTKADILANWERRDHFAFKTHYCTSVEDSKALQTYRPVADCYAALPDKVIRATGYKDGDWTRAKFLFGRVRVFADGTWKEIAAKELAKYKPRDIIQNRIMTTSTESSKPAPARFDTTGLEPFPDFLLSGPFAWSQEEVLRWKRENWPTFAQWEGEQELTNNATSQVISEPVPESPLPKGKYEGMDIDALLKLKEELLKWILNK